MDTSEAGNSQHNSKIAVFPHPGGEEKKIRGMDNLTFTEPCFSLTSSTVCWILSLLPAFVSLELGITVCHSRWFGVQVIFCPEHL